MGRYKIPEKEKVKRTQFTIRLPENEVEEKGGKQKIYGVFKNAFKNAKKVK